MRKQPNPEAHLHWMKRKDYLFSKRAVNVLFSQAEYALKSLKFTKRQIFFRITEKYLR